MNKPISPPTIAISTNASAVSTLSAGASFAFLTKTPSDRATQIKQNVKMHPVSLNEVPMHYHTWIGLICTHWAYAEWIVMGTICTLLGINRKEGRALFPTRTKELFKKMKYVMNLRGLNLTVGPLWSLYEDCEKKRDLLGHGVWLKNIDTGELCIQDASGEWEIEGENKPGVSKRDYPEAVPIADTWLENTLKEIQNAIFEARKFDQQLEALLASSGNTSGTQSVPDCDAPQTPESTQTRGKEPEPQLEPSGV